MGRSLKAERGPQTADVHSAREAGPTSPSRRRFLGLALCAFLVARAPRRAAADWPPKENPKGRPSRALKAAEHAMRERRKKSQAARQRPKATRPQPARPSKSAAEVPPSVPAAASKN